MQKILFCLFASFAALTGFTQATTNADVAVTVVDPVGVTEFPAVNKMLSPSLFTTTVKPKGQTPDDRVAIEIASFSITDANNHFALSLPSVSIRMIDQATKNSFLLENLQVVPVVSQQANSFTLNSSPAAQKPVSAGNYFNPTQLDITIHFN